MAAQQELARFADQAVRETVPVIDCQPLAPDIFRLRMECPPMARLIRPGQFLMVRIHGVDDPLIGRPLALFDTDPQSEAVDVVFVVGGNMTRRLAQLRTGDALDIWGPLGNGFSMTAADHVLLVAGGIGFTPFLAVAKSYLGWKTYGEPQRDGRAKREAGNVLLWSALGQRACQPRRLPVHRCGGADFDRQRIRRPPRFRDGLINPDAGLKRRATRRILCCGPEPMMKAVAEIALQHQIPCEVSLETPMACGIGICFTCVARIRDESGQWDYRRTCVEGPVFAGQDVCWD